MDLFADWDPGEIPAGFFPPPEGELRGADRALPGPAADERQQHDFTFSVGRHKFDAAPENRTAETFDAFEVEVLRQPFARAKGLRYVAATFSDGHRSKETAEGRCWLPFDFDMIADAETWAQLYAFLSQWRGCAYTTASHTPENPRARAILAASRPMQRDECIRVATAIQKRIEAHLGDGAVKLDTSVYRPEQACYTPTVGSTVVRWADGDPVDVDELLREAPEIQERPGKRERLDGIASTDPVLRKLNELGMVKRARADGAYNVECPCEADHTGESGESSTVYFLPMTAGVRYGRFVCLHSHCRGRDNSEFLAALGLNPATVYREQAGDEGAPRKHDTEGLLVPIGQLVERVAPIPWVVKGILQANTLACFYGDPETWKSLAAIDLGLSIAAGLPEWRGHKVTRPGPVVYVCGEGQHGVAIRAEAWMRTAGVKRSDVAFFVTRAPVGVLDAGAIMSLREAIGQMLEGVPPALVIFDTLQRNFGPGDENSTGDMSTFIANLDQYIRIPFGACTLPVHHSGAGDKTRSRGSTVLRGSLDIEYQFTKNADGIVTMSCTKMKDGAKPEPKAFTLRVVDLFGIEDEDGNTETGPVLESTEPPKKAKARGAAQSAILAIVKTFTAGNQGARIDYKRLRAAYLSTGNGRSSFYAAFRSLIDGGDLCQEGPEVWVT